MGTKTRWVLVIAAVAMVLVVVGLTVLEATAQIGEAWRLYAHAESRLHPFLQNRAAPYLDGMNAHGFRGAPITLEKPAGVLRVFTLGGSTTLGILNDYEDSYPALLEQILRRRLPDRVVEVQNAGGDWYSSAHDLINYQLRVRQFSPDVVVLFEAINDLYRGFSPPWLAHGEFEDDYAHFLGPQARLLGPQMGFVDATPVKRPLDLLVWRVWKRRLTGEPSPYDPSPENVRRLREILRPVPVDEFRSLPSFRRNYDLLLRNALADGVRVIVASQPFLYDENLDAEELDSLFFAPLLCAENGTYPDLPSMRKGMRSFNDAAQRLASDHDATFLDFEAAVPKTSVYFEDDVHLTRAANEILAELTADAIVGDQGDRSRRPAPPGGYAGGRGRAAGVPHRGDRAR